MRVLTHSWISAQASGVITPWVVICWVRVGGFMFNNCNGIYWPVVVLRYGIEFGLSFYLCLVGQSFLRCPYLPHLKHGPIPAVPVKPGTSFLPVPSLFRSSTFTTLSSSSSSLTYSYPSNRFSFLCIFIAELNAACKSTGRVPLTHFLMSLL